MFQVVFFWIFVVAMLITMGSIFIDSFKMDFNLSDSSHSGTSYSSSNKNYHNNYHNGNIYLRTYTGKSKILRKITNEKLKEFNLTVLNLNRNKKKVTVIIPSNAIDVSSQFLYHLFKDVYTRLGRDNFNKQITVTSSGVSIEKELKDALLLLSNRTEIELV
jgi:hypothetical protein